MDVPHLLLPDIFLGGRAFGFTIIQLCQVFVIILGEWLVKVKAMGLERGLGLLWTVSLVTGTKPELQGHDLSQMKDANGVRGGNHYKVPCQEFPVDDQPYHAVNAEMTREECRRRAFCKKIIGTVVHNAHKACEVAPEAGFWSSELRKSGRTLQDSFLQCPG
jgi:hypothetical protein